MRGDPETALALERLDARRASERAQIAARPKHGWIEAERYKQAALAEAQPQIVRHRGRGRPRKDGT